MGHLPDRRAAGQGPRPPKALTQVMIPEALDLPDVEAFLKVYYPNRPRPRNVEVFSMTMTMTSTKDANAKQKTAIRGQILRKACKTV